MENKKTPITHELILYRYKRGMFGFYDPKAVPFILLLAGIVIFGPYYFLTKEESKVDIPYWMYASFMGIVVVVAVLYQYHKYKKMKNQNYQLVTDHLKRKFNPIIEPLKYYHNSNDFTRFYEFRKYGKCPAYNWFIRKHRNQVEGEIHYNYHNAEIGDPFYLVILGNRIIQVYSAHSYCLPEETKEE